MQPFEGIHGSMKCERIIENRKRAPDISRFQIYCQEREEIPPFHSFVLDISTNHKKKYHFLHILKLDAIINS